MGKLGKGLGLAALIGFISGLLFAPQKGEETRVKVKEAIDKGKEKLKEIQEQWTKKEG